MGDSQPMEIFGKGCRNSLRALSTFQYSESLQFLNLVGILSRVGVSRVLGEWTYFSGILFYITPFYELCLAECKHLGHITY